MLIPSTKHTNQDLAAWARHERADLAWSRLPAFRRAIDTAMARLSTFASADPTGYVSTSWGKDSVVVAHMAATLNVPQPLVWVVMRPIDNPECVTVRDTFLAAHPHAYDEVVCWFDPSSKLTSAPGFREAAKRHGVRHALGIRAEESSAREMSARVHGVTTERTCRPILDWRAEDVFAYLLIHDLPVHPAYAMSYGGNLDRRRLRVSSVGGKRGAGHGRREWEERYYRDVLRERERYLAALAGPATS